MTTVQFIYMMGVLWLIFAGAILQPKENPDELVNILAIGGIVLGFAHIVLAVGMLVWGLLGGYIDTNNSGATLIY